MAVTLTSLTVTPSWTDFKRLTISGGVSVRESVALRIVGCGDDTSVVFKISSEDGRVDYAKFPFAATDAWTVSGSDLTATLTLNTALLVAAFASYGPDDRIDVSVTVASRTNSNLYAKGRMQIGNWIENEDDPVAYSTPLADDLDALETAVDDLSDAFDAHNHDGTTGKGVKIAHSNLVGAGTNTHAAIDAALVNLASAISTNASNIAIQTGRIDDHETRITTLEGRFTDMESLPAFDPVTAYDEDVRQQVKLISDYLRGTP